MKIAYVVDEYIDSTFYTFLTDIDLSNLIDGEEVVLRFKPNIDASGIRRIVIDTKYYPYLLFVGLSTEERSLKTNDFIVSNNCFDTNYEYHFHALWYYDHKTPTLDFISYNYYEEEKENDNMACNNTCKYFSYVTGASIVSGALILTLNNTPSVVDGNNICFRFNRGIAIPSGAETLPVYISINSVSYPVWNKYGNSMTGADLIPTTSGTNYCPRYTYHAYFGTQDSALHIIVHNIPRKSCTIYYE